MADGRSLTSAENGKKGGRPLASSTLQAQKARQYIAEQLDKNLGPIVAKAVEQAMEGNQQARDWLSDRGWGKAMQSIDHTTNGKDMPLPILTNVQGDEHTKEN